MPPSPADKAPGIRSGSAPLPYAAILPTGRSTVTRPMARRLAITPTPNVSYSRRPRPSSENDGLGALDPLPGRVAADVGSIGVAEGLAWGGLTGFCLSGLVCELDQAHGKSIGDHSLIASFPSIAFCLLKREAWAQTETSANLPAKPTLYCDLSLGPTSPVILTPNLWTVLRQRLNQPFFFFFFRSSARFSFLGLSAASEACSSSLSLRSASSQWSSSWPFGRPCFSQSWWARSWTRAVSSKARPFHRDDFSASPVTKERGFATTAALNASIPPSGQSGRRADCPGAWRATRLYRRRWYRGGPQGMALRLFEWSTGHR